MRREHISPFLVLVLLTLSIRSWLVFVRAKRNLFNDAAMQTQFTQRRWAAVRNHKRIDGLVKCGILRESAYRRP